MISGDSITVSLGGRAILQSAYVDAVPGQITVLVGRSGAGKTTLFEILVGRRWPDGGQVRWNGERVPRPSLALLARRGLFYHPDRPWLAMSLTPADHFALLGGTPQGDGLGVTAWLDRRVGTLSGGELRLTEIALGLARAPRVALLDEPFRGLEPRHREEVAAALRLLAERGTAVLYADHDVESVRRTADRLFSMEQGATRLVEGFRERPLTEWYHAWPV
jgi:ABC-type multidrug transport system ATPase subunit